MSYDLKKKKSIAHILNSKKKSIYCVCIYLWVFMTEWLDYMHKLNIVGFEGDSVYIYLYVVQVSLKAIWLFLDTFN